MYGYFLNIISILVREFLNYVLIALHYLLIYSDIKCHSLDLQRYPEGITAIEAINKCGASGLENDPLVLTKVTEIHGREIWTGLGIFTQLTPWIELIGN